jgi:hypothetical protein
MQKALGELAYLTQKERKKERKKEGRKEAGGGIGVAASRDDRSIKTMTRFPSWTRYELLK